MQKSAGGKYYLKEGNRYGCALGRLAKMEINPMDELGIIWGKHFILHKNIQLFSHNHEPIKIFETASIIFDSRTKYLKPH